MPIPARRPTLQPGVLGAVARVLEPGDLVGDGRYRVLRVLGQGANATVFQVRDVRLDADRALKQLHPRLVRTSNRLRQRFVSEARIMARLRHPAIATVHDVVEETGNLFIVMELVPGGTLGRRVRTGGPLGPRAAVEVLLPVLDGLAHAHARGVIHRDVKPENVLLDPDGSPKLTDFGIARAAQARRATGGGGTMGTLAYMAPECRLAPEEVDARADVYAVGATLYHVLTGEDPHRLVLEDPPPLDGLPAPLAAWIRRATARDPAGRPPDAAAARDELAAVLERLPPDPAGSRSVLLSLQEGVDAETTLGGDWDPEVLLAAARAAPRSPAIEAPRSPPRRVRPPALRRAALALLVVLGALASGWVLHAGWLAAHPP